MNKVISWNTTKTEDGFRWTVYAVAYGIPTETLKTGVCRTRAIAVNRAKKWCIYLKRTQVAA